MLLSEVRKSFKDAGYKLKVKSFSFGKHATVYKDGEAMPSIFYDGNHRDKWQSAIELKSGINPVFDDKTLEIIYGFGVDK